MTRTTSPGGTCSTAGGIKQFRVYLLGKQFFWELKRLLMPRTAVVECPIWEGTRRVFVDDARLRQFLHRLQAARGRGRARLNFARQGVVGGGEREADGGINNGS